MKAIHRMSDEAALELLDSLEELQLAGVAQGRPLLRTLHGARLGRAVYFHGSAAGEKRRLDSGPVCLAGHRVVARIPSYFRDPERACPATTLFESVHVEGCAEPVSDPELKARALSVLLAHLQPEARYTPLSAQHPLYQSVLAKLWVVEVKIERLTGKLKLGQHLPQREVEGIVAGLWQRGGAGDAAAIARMLAAHPSPPEPVFLRGPDGVRLLPQLGQEDLPEVLGLLRGQYWTLESSDHEIARAQLSSSAWVGARSASGELVGTARAISDGANRALILDVAVAASHRARGVGAALMQLLLSHGAVRRARRVSLGTRDAQGFYRRFGFSEARGNTAMTLLRSGD